ncbi:amidohydrolase family protein [Rhodococcus artemisiae]|uniref:Amidohydrolase family protein n=1 Tax=Rhodococcus artemisiae TaxID=714159 RepID=A0ABU7LIX6_9NOCA|nr:amidohydrolase family protein [Rhodococcus artemisiae]MEE2061465.1 amidohydrolase family protein [Rhodococcus artemisiae]
MTSESSDDPRTTLSRRNLLRATAVASVGAGTLLAGAGVAAAQPARRQNDPLPSQPYRVDLHAHFLPPEYRASLLAHGHFTIGGYPTPEWSPEAAIDFMDRYGIAAQVLSVSDPGVDFLPGGEAKDMARYCNTYAAELFGRHPTRFGGLAVLPMHDLGAALAELDYAFDVLRLDGVVLLSAYNGVYLGDPRFEPLMHALNARNAYVFVHPAAIPDDAKPTLPLPDFLAEFTFDTTRAATLLMAGGTLARYPNIRFQLSHAGGTLPFLAHRIGIASQTPVGDVWPDSVPRPSVLDVARYVNGFFYDTALSPAPSAMRSVLAVGQLDRIVFGSDWPFSALTLSGSGDPQPELSETFDTASRLRIERDNALRELPRLADALT